MFSAENTVVMRCWISCGLLLLSTTRQKYPDVIQVSFLGVCFTWFQYKYYISNECRTSRYPQIPKDAKNHSLIYSWHLLVQSTWWNASNNGSLSNSTISNGFWCWVLLYINYFFRIAELKLNQYQSNNGNEQSANNIEMPGNKIYSFSWFVFIHYWF